VASREIVEVVTKKKRGEMSREALLSLSSRKDQQDLKFLENRGERKPEIPNLYGRYQLVLTFFVDSFFDNSTMVSENNRISTLYDKRFHMTRANVPKVQRDLSPTKRPNLLENSYVLEEESEERASAFAKGKLVKKSGLEFEQPVYPVGIKKSKDSPYYEREGKEMSIDSSKWTASPVLVKRPADVSEWESMLNNPFTQQKENSREDRNPSEWESRLMERIKMRETEKESKKIEEEEVKQRRSTQVTEMQRNSNESRQLQQRNNNDNYIMIQDPSQNMSSTTESGRKMRPKSRSPVQRTPVTPTRQPPTSIPMNNYFEPNFGSSRMPTNIPSSFTSQQNPPSFQNINPTVNFVKHNPNQNRENILRTPPRSPISYQNTPSKIILNQPSVNNPTMSLGRVRRTIRSQDGDDFVLQKGKFAVITRTYDRQGIIEILSEGLTGIFPAECIEILHGSELEELKKRITIGQMKNPGSNPEGYKMASMNKSPIREGSYSKENSFIEEREMRRERRPIFVEKPRVSVSPIRDLVGTATIRGSVPVNDMSLQSTPTKFAQRQMKRQQKY